MQISLPEAGQHTGECLHGSVSRLRLSPPSMQWTVCGPLGVLRDALLLLVGWGRASWGM